MGFRGPFFKYAIPILIVLLIILLLYYTAPFFSPILWFVTAVLLPILFSTILYYVLRPIVDYLDQWMPRYAAILLTYLFLTIIFAISAYYIIPFIYNEIQTISDEKLDSLKTNISAFIDTLKYRLSLSNQTMLENILSSYIPKINSFIYAQSLGLLGTLANITIALILTPFVLYYFLRDDALFTPFVLRYVPLQFQEEVGKIIKEIDNALEEFIHSQMFVALTVGSFVFVGYLIIGLPNALSLSLFAVFFYIIPFLGTLLSLIPALFIALGISFEMAIKATIVVLIAHLIDTNFVTPNIMSKRLKIHPLTIILLLLAAGSLYGLIGILLVTPTYAILKVIVWNLYKISRLRYAEAKQAAREEEKLREETPPI